MQSSLLNLQGELEAARKRLKGVEDNIKKNIGREVIGPPLHRAGFKRNSRHLDTSIEGNDPPVAKSRIYLTPTSGRRVINLSTRNSKTEERIPAKKRLGEQAVTVFSRLSGPPKDDYETKGRSKVTSQVIVQDTPSRKDILEAQSGDNQSKARNRRMFGALLGTLQKFRQEEDQLKEKEEKRAQVEKKLEDAAIKEKEENKKKRQELFSNRRQQQFEIRQLEFKLTKLKQFAEWEATKKKLMNFIQTKATPCIFYLPKTHTEKTQELLEETKDQIQKSISSKKEEIMKAIDDHHRRNDKKVDKRDDDDDVKRSEDLVTGEEFEVEPDEEIQHEVELVEAEDEDDLPKNEHEEICLPQQNDREDSDDDRVKPNGENVSDKENSHMQENQEISVSESV